MSPQISIIVPLYNEEKGFRTLTKRLNDIIEKSDISIEVVLIDDGSTDNTPILMKMIALENKKYQCLFLSRNCNKGQRQTKSLE